MNGTLINLGEKNEGLSSGTRSVQLRRHSIAILLATIAIFAALSMQYAATAAEGNVRTGLPDGNRATNIYSIDGGYGLGEGLYAELVASLIGD